ncbi:reverse transcriptase domain-containing protein [Tanacetum coccineum]
MFLGYHVNTKGIKICPDKVDTVLSLQLPKCLKDVQKLNGKLASLNRFLAKSAEKSLPFFKTLKKCTKKSDFLWTEEAEAAFRQMKEHIAKLPMLTAPEVQEELIVLLASIQGSERPEEEGQDDSAKEEEPLPTQWTCHGGSACIDGCGEDLDSKISDSGKNRRSKAPENVDSTSKLVENKLDPFPEGPGKSQISNKSMELLTKLIEAKPRGNYHRNQVQKVCIGKPRVHIGLPGEHNRHERANQSLGEGIKARLGKDNKNWMEEISHVLWAHRTMVKSSNGDTPFSLTYGTEAVIPAEIGMPTFRTAELDMAKMMKHCKST